MTLIPLKPSTESKMQGENSEIKDNKRACWLGNHQIIDPAVLALGKDLCNVGGRGADELVTSIK